MIALTWNAEFRLLLGIRHTVIVHLERTDHAAHVMGMNHGSRFRITLGKQGMHSFLANTLGKLLITRAAFVLELSRRKIHFIECSLKIQARAAAKDRKPLLTKQTLDMRPGIRLIERSRIRDARVHDIDKAQGHQALLGHHLGRTDIHTAIDLHRVTR